MSERRKDLLLRCGMIGCGGGIIVRVYYLNVDEGLILKGLRKMVEMEIGIWDDKNDYDTSTGKRSD